MTDPLEEGPENYANRMEFRLGPSLKYPLAITHIEAGYRSGALT
jgi:hypothetical protein